MPTRLGGLPSPPARAPGQLEGFPLGQRIHCFRKMLVELGPRLQASPLHTGSWVCCCLGWQKAQETVRGWQTFGPVLRVGMFVHTHDRLADRVREQGAWAKRPLSWDLGF